MNLNEELVGALCCGGPLVLLSLMVMLAGAWNFFYHYFFKWRKVKDLRRGEEVLVTEERSLISRQSSTRSNQYPMWDEGDEWIRGANMPLSVFFLHSIRETPFAVVPIRLQEIKGMPIPVTPINAPANTSAFLNIGWTVAQQCEFYDDEEAPADHGRMALNLRRRIDGRRYLPGEYVFAMQVKDAADAYDKIFRVLDDFTREFFGGIDIEALLNVSPAQPLIIRLRPPPICRENTLHLIAAGGPPEVCTSPREVQDLLGFYLTRLGRAKLGRIYGIYPAEIRVLDIVFPEEIAKRRLERVTMADLMRTLEARGESTAKNVNKLVKEGVDANVAAVMVSLQQGLIGREEAAGLLFPLFGIGGMVSPKPKKGGNP